MCNCGAKAGRVRFAGWFILFQLLAGWGASNAQNLPRIDSLQSLLMKSADAHWVGEVHWQLAKEFARYDSAKAAYHISLALPYTEADSQLELRLLYLVAEIDRSHLQLERARAGYQLLVRQAKAYGDSLYCAFGWLGFNRLAQQISDLPQARSYLDSASYLGGKESTYQFRAELSEQWCRFYRNLGDTDSCQMYREQNLKEALRWGNPYWILRSYSDIIKRTADQGNYLEARLYHEECRAFLDQLPQGSFQDMRAMFFWAESDLFMQMGMPDSAVAAMETYLALFQTIKIPYRAAIARANFTNRLIRTGHYERGVLEGEQALAELIRWRRNKAVVWTQYLLGKAYNHLNQVTKARAILEPALEESRRLRNLRNVANILLELGMMEVALGAYDKAATYLEEGLQLSESYQFRDLLEPYTLGLAKSHDALGNPQQALDYMWRHQELYEESRIQEIEQREQVKAAVFDYEKRNDSLAHSAERQELIFENQVARQALKKTRWIVGFSVVCGGVVLLGVGYRRKQQSAKNLRRLSTAVQEKNQEILTKSQQLEKVIEDKDQFFSIISHDLRGPIRAFASLAFLLKTQIEHGETKDLEELVDMLDLNARRVIDLLENLLQWALEQQGAMPFSPEMLPVDESVTEVISIFSLQAENKRITLQAETSQEQVYADRNYLATILRNLVSNALKYTQEGGRVAVRTCTVEDQIEIQIQDNGIGIAPEIQDKLFDTNKDKVRSGTHGEKGTGLGLSLVHDFVTRSGGTLQVESTLGEGTTFQVRLPKGGV
ncbi:MAG TPA: hypothetical protein DCP28_04390 [Cytophagales bacterium]|nr:hypothetical protein [Cytophagales bacterium]